MTQQNTSRRLAVSFAFLGVLLAARVSRGDGHPIFSAGFDLEPTADVSCHGENLYPAIASNGSGHLVVWAYESDPRGPEDTSGPPVSWNVLAARVGVDGTALAPHPLVVASDAEADTGELPRPDVASDGSDYLVVWEREQTILATRVDRSGERLDDEPFLVMQGSAPRVAFDGARYLVVAEHGDTDVYGVEVSTAGRVGTPFAIAHSIYVELRPSVACRADGGCLVAWVDPRHVAEQGLIAYYGATIAGTSVVADDLLLGSFPGTAEDADVDVAAGVLGYYAVWRSGVFFGGAPFNADGAVMGSALSRLRPGLQAARVGCDGSNYLVALAYELGESHGVESQVVGAFGLPITPEPVIVSPDAEVSGRGSAVGSNGDGYLVGYAVRTGLSDSSIRVHRVSAAGDVFAATTCSVCPVEQWWPAAAWTGEEFLVLWQKRWDWWTGRYRRSSEGHPIYGTYAHDRGPLTSEGGFLLDGTREFERYGFEHRLDLACDRSECVLAMTDHRPSPDSYDTWETELILWRIVGRAATLLVAREVEKNARTVRIASAGGAGYLVAWTDYDAVRDEYHAFDVEALLLDADGSPTIDVTLANSRNDEWIEALAATGRPGEGYLAVWSSSARTFQGWHNQIRIARVTAEGAVEPAGGTWISNDYPSDKERTTAAAASDGEGYLVAYRDDHRLALARVTANATVTEQAMVPDPDGEQEPLEIDMTFDGRSYLVVWRPSRGTPSEGPPPLYGHYVEVTEGPLADAIGPRFELSDESWSVTAAANGEGRAFVVFGRPAPAPFDRMRGRFVENPRAGELGAPCVADDGCTSGHCDGGVCCDSACSGGAESACVTCTTASGLGFIDGRCRALGFGDPCDDGDACTTNDVCASAPTGPLRCAGTGTLSPCDDGNPCTFGDHCQPTGWAPPNDPAICAAGTPYGCPARGECQASVACDGAGGCTVAPAPDGTPCGVDDDPCTAVGTCQDGACTGATPLPVGTLCNRGDACHTDGRCTAFGDCAQQDRLCLDLNPCTEDGCDPETGCVFAPLSGGSCNDGNPCTGGDTCLAGACAGTPVPSCCTSDAQCDDANPCTRDTCTAMRACQHDTVAMDGAVCDDGSACTRRDTCRAGHCGGGDPVVCVLLDACHVVGTCSPFTGRCSEPPAPAGTQCGDGDACTTGDACDGAGRCVPGAPVFCAGGSDCRSASLCDPLTGGCLPSLPKAAGAACDDGDPGTTHDRCDGAGSCVAGDAASCPAPGPCHGPAVGQPTDSGGFRCLTGPPLPEGTPCEDGDACTPADVCDGDGRCVGQGWRSCDDGDPCTDDDCFWDTGCVHAANDSTCDDGNACTTGDVCVSGRCRGTFVDGCCSAHADCDDGDPCTADTCETAAGSCVHDAAPMEAAACDDGDPCTIGDRCLGGRCLPGEALACEQPAAPCLDALCRSDTGVCETLPKVRLAACSDGDPCTENDRCDGHGICVPGPEKVCVPTAPCRDAAACDSEQPGGCAELPQPDGVPCDDGDPCTDHDRCQSGVCVGGTSGACGDGVACTDDYCAADGCHHARNDARCDDGDPCTDDRCGTTGCRHTASTARCDDGDRCTTDDRCRDGVCAGAAVTGCGNTRCRVDGAWVTCGDDNPCTTERCVADVGCVFSPLDGFACDDGSPCTLDDTCLGDTCVGDELPGCDGGPGTGCISPEDQDGAAGFDTGVQIDCALDCLGAGDRAACLAGCVGEAAALTTGCTDCFAERLACLIDVCGSRCTSTEDCQACLDEDCAVPFYLCAGLTCGPQGCDAASCLDPAAGWATCGDDDPCTTTTCTGEGCQVGAAEGASCDDGEPCTGDDACDADGACVGTPLAGSACDDDNLCTENDTCVGGVCGGIRIAGCQIVSQGSACLDDADLSAALRFDNEAQVDCGLGCVAVPAAQRAACVAQCVAATAPRLSGACADCYGQRILCAIAHDCATAGCVRNQCDLSFLACSGLGCDQETCSHSVCVQAGGPDEGRWIYCEPDDPCTACSITEGCTVPDFVVSCADGHVCTENDACAAGTCAGEAIPGCCESAADCDDGDPCTADRCLSLECAHDPVVCDDGDACNGGESCHAVLGCVPGTPLACDDGDPCNGVERCDAETGCLPGAAACDDNDVCDGVETCDPATGCLPGTSVDCEAIDRCHEPGVCNALFGCLAGRAVVCDDGDACNGMETCDPATGCVAGTPLACGNGDVCDGVEGCDPEAGCVAGAPLACDDGDACNGTERCDPTRGCVAGVALDCDDGDACNGTERCDPVAGCLAGAALDCDDGDACTTDRCDVGSGACTNEPIAGCICTSHTARRCVGGNVTWFDGCGDAEDIAEDCGGRGCVGDACCPTGTHEVGGTCEADVGPVEPVPDAGTAPDAGTPSDAGTARDAGGAPSDTGPARDAGGTPSDTGTARDAGGAPSDTGTARDAGGTPPDTGTARDAGGTPPDTGTARDAGGTPPDTGTARDAGGAPPDAGTARDAAASPPDGGGGGGCDVSPCATGAGPLLLLALSALLLWIGGRGGRRRRRHDERPPSTDNRADLAEIHDPLPFVVLHGSTEVRGVEGDEAVVAAGRQDAAPGGGPRPRSHPAPPPPGSR